MKIIEVKDRTTVLVEQLLVKGTLHWVEATMALDAEVHMLDFLLQSEQGEGDFMDYLNPNSLVVLQGCKATPDMKQAKAGGQVPISAQRLLLRGQQILHAGAFAVQPDRVPQGQL